MTAKSLKLDLYKTHKQDYVAPRNPVLMKVPRAQYLAIEGRGEPGGAEFEACIGALYAVAFTIKMTRKFAGKQDYAVCKLEGLWWADGTHNLGTVPPKSWCWKLLIRTPQFIGPAQLKAAVAALLERGKDARVKEVRLEKLDEGACVQALHVGPYDQVGTTIEKMRAFAQEMNYSFSGLHHEIYLSDPRRVAPERLRTIVREPVSPT